MPDVYNLKLLAQILRISVDSLLDTEIQNSEKIVETITIGGVRFEIVKKPETIFAGKIIYAKDFSNLEVFDTFEHKTGYIYMPIENIKRGYTFG